MYVNKHMHKHTRTHIRTFQKFEFSYYFIIPSSITITNKRNRFILKLRFSFYSRSFFRHMKNYFFRLRDDFPKLPEMFVFGCKARSIIRHKMMMTKKIGAGWEILEMKGRCQDHATMPQMVSQFLYTNRPNLQFR